MISRPAGVISVVLAVFGAGAGLALLHLENRRLEHRVAARAAEFGRAAALRRDNRELQAGVQTGPWPAAADMARQIADARREVAVLEQHARELAAQQARQTAFDRDSLASNRDPRTGLTRLEFFQPAGRLTPAAAVQTAIWAAMKGDDRALMEATALRPDTRTKAEALVANLPAETRAQWTPEKLAALWMSSVINDVSALQITDETYEDPRHAMVNLRIANHDQPEHVNLRLTSSGWKIILPGKEIDELSRRVSAVASPSP